LAEGLTEWVLVFAEEALRLFGELLTDGFFFPPAFACEVLPEVFSFDAVLPLDEIAA
jgi:hypothetical protein